MSRRIFEFFALGVFLSFGSGIAAAAELLPISIAGAPSARTGAGVVSTGNEVLIWGGDDGGFSSQLINSGALYNPTADSWRTISSNGAPSPRRNAFTFYKNGRVIIWGGCIRADSFNGRCEQFSDDGGIYDVATDSWTSIPVQSLVRFAPKADDAAKNSFVQNGKLIHFGVEVISAARKAVEYDLLAGSWRVLPTASDLYVDWNPVRIFESRGQIYIWYSEWRGIGIYDVQSGTVQNLTRPKSSSVGVVEHDGRLIFSEWQDGCTEERPISTPISTFDLNSRTFSQLPSLPNGGCWSHLIVADSSILAWGYYWQVGSGPNSWTVQRSYELYRLSDDQSTWTTVTTNTHDRIGAIDDRSVEPVVAGGYIIFWGGVVPGPLSLPVAKGVRIKTSENK